MIFSDKTGTLTMNKMIFKKCQINGAKYGEMMKNEVNLYFYIFRLTMKKVWWSLLLNYFERKSNQKNKMLKMVILFIELNSLSY